MEGHSSCHPVWRNSLRDCKGFELSFTTEDSNNNINCVTIVRRDSVAPPAVLDKKRVPREGYMENEECTDKSKCRRAVKRKSDLYHSLKLHVTFFLNSQRSRRNY